MRDPLSDVLKYVTQPPFRPIPTDGKQPLKGWAQYQRRAPEAYERHRWWPTKRKNHYNVALICGPACGILVLNVNIKGGKDGRKHLKGPVDNAPAIQTPSGGVAYCFRPPDPARYPSEFRTHVYPKGYDGLEFRGVGGIQLVPPSRIGKHGYKFLPPWTIEHLQRDLADMPNWLLEAWLALDARENFGRDRARNSGHARKPASAPAQTTDLSRPDCTPRLQSQSTERPQTSPTPEPPGAPAPPYTTITTLLTLDNGRVFVDGFDVHERECAESICGRMGLPVESLDDGRVFLCRLPGHHEHEPSAMWGKTETGYYLYKDWHERSGDPLFTVPEVFAALTSGVVRTLPTPSRMAWRLRLMVEDGLIEPPELRMRALPDDASLLLQRYYAGFRLLVACKACHPKTLPNAGTPFTTAFAAHWCGIPKGSVWSAQQEAIRRDLIIFSGIYKGQALYRPGKEE